MRITWMLLLLGQAVLGQQGSDVCLKGFRKVLEYDRCDYFAFGPLFMSSYCDWQHQLEYGITKTFCCGGICAYCFQQLDSIDGSSSSDSSGSTVLGDINPTTFYPYDIGRDFTNSDEQSEFGEMMVIRMKRMMEEFLYADAENKTEQALT
uniref:Putative secreted protein n=1 Tax=Aedes albopictus TaxID=7160 RepID=A0A023EGV8_AEDAL